MKKQKYKMTREHKRKIGSANKISLKGKHCSPETEYKKGRTSERKGKPYYQIREERHYKWKGGSRATARRIAERYGFDLTRCGICGKVGKTVVHHVDENFYNNNLKNMRILCYGCHNLLHEFGKRNGFQKGHKGFRRKVK